MIYFKFPFNDKLYSTDQKSGKDNVNFHSFDGLTQLTFEGNTIEIHSEQLDRIIFNNENLQNDESHYNTELKEEYLQSLQEVIEMIKENGLSKMVLSRRKIFKDFNRINYHESFKNLCHTYPNAFRYLFNDGENAWMGAFSEVLGKFNKTTHEFETMSLAGTLPVSEGWSEKEIEEQKPVSSYIQNILESYSEHIEISKTYDHISGNIKHLRTDFKATIQPEDLDSIIQDLHPTPAVCGIPKDFCKEQIQKFEKFPREFYAGYIKIETQETIHYFVNLRCAKLYRDSVHVFVGGGITAQSNPEKEWIETELKSEAILGNLVISQE